MTAEKRGGSQKLGNKRDGERMARDDRQAGAKGNNAGSKDSVASSLRQAYQQTIAEDVPDEMLELLKKLG